MRGIHTSEPDWPYPGALVALRTSDNNFAARGTVVRPSEVRPGWWWVRPAFDWDRYFADSDFHLGVDDLVPQPGSREWEIDHGYPPDPDRNPMPSAIDALTHILAWIDQRAYGDNVGERNTLGLAERAEIRDHVAAFLEQCRGEAPQMTIKPERPQMTRPERLDTYWSWQGLQEAMREIDVDRQDISRRQHSSGMQVVGTDIVARFLADLDEAFYDAAEIAAQKRRRDSRIN